MYINFQQNWASRFFFRFGNLHVAKPCTLLWGSGVCPPRIFFKWCNLVCFGAYFDQILFLKFYITIQKLPFSIYKINVLDTRLLWGNSSEENLKTFYD